MPTQSLRTRSAAIAESATLAVDAKAKALKAAGRPVIGFGAGEPDFPTPDYIVEAAQRRLPRPALPPYTPAGGPARAEGRRSRPRRCATPATRSRPARCWSPTAASRPSTRRSPPCSTRATRCSLPAPYWTTYPEAIRLAGGVPVAGAHRRDAAATWPRVEQLEAAPHRAHQGAAVRARRPTRPARSTRPSRSRRSASGPRTHGLWVVTDEIYEHLVYGGATFASMPGAWRRSWPTAAWSSTAWPRPTR